MTHGSHVSYGCTSVILDELSFLSPSIHVQLVGCRGQARVMVSVVTDTDPPMPHAYSLVGQNARDGRCLVEVGVETEMYAQ